MQPNPLMIIALGVAPEKEGEFNEFYQHRFLPAVLASSADVVSIRRYEELTAPGTVRLQTKQYLTIYELDGVEALGRSDGIFQSEGMRDLVTEFQAWKNNDLRNFSRINYQPSWTHERGTPDGPFGARPLTLWSLDVEPDLDVDFNNWYEATYLPLQIADIPGWCAVRRYFSQNRDPKRFLTFFESADESALNRSVGDLGALHRVSQNREWKRRVERAAVWHEVMSFRCVYLRGR
ncbi:MAG: hypothetical protein K2Z81_08575 [Cyanobacteria bacterium]|nr:hypothetical protein [Cyanobacteriota bacterium]